MFMRRALIFLNNKFTCDRRVFLLNVTHSAVSDAVFHIFGISYCMTDMALVNITSYMNKSE